MSYATEIIVVVVAIMGLGVFSQVLADRLEVPSVLFLILAGVGVGPEGLGIVTPRTFGDALPAIVGLSVAIIVFEGPSTSESTDSGKLLARRFGW